MVSVKSLASSFIDRLESQQVEHKTDTEKNKKRIENLRAALCGKQSDITKQKPSTSGLAIKRGN